MSRAAILGNIRRALGRGSLDEEQVSLLQARLEQGPAPHVVPARGRVLPVAQRDLFVALAERNAATLTLVSGAENVPGAVTTYLAGRNLEGGVVLAPDPWLLGLPWADYPLLQLREGPVTADGAVAVTAAFAGIAETGTVMVVSGPRASTPLTFVAETHLAVLRSSQIVGTFEEAWERLRAQGPEPIPRSVTFVSGPSRTADIEQKMYMGAHGPRHLHIIVVEEAGGG